MSFSGTWDETSPPGPEAINLGDNRIRDFKRDIRERLVVDHYVLQNEGGDAKIGYHSKSTYINQGSDPVSVAAAFIAYAKQSDSYSELFCQHENAGVIQLTRLGKLLISSLGIASEANGDILTRISGVWGRRGIGSALDQIRTNAGATDWEWFTPSATFSTGMIMMWSGTIATIPSGWVFCNGSNGTPDLRDRFVICAKQDSGGVAKSNVSGALAASGGPAAQPPLTTSSLSGTTETHSSGGNNSAGNHSHTTDVTPPYYALAYIMKT